MAHTHPVTDKDTHFEIDGGTRLVKNTSDTKTMLVQFDHKSERFTFKIPREIDGHDLMDCNRVRVHFLNLERSKRTEHKGVSPITDTLAVHPEDDKFVTCSWLVPNEATQIVGYLYFVIEFACVDGNEVLYSWNTARHTSITIAEGLNGGKEVVEANIDILTQWENELKANQITNITQTTTSTEDNGENVWTATFGDGRTQELKVRNGSKGDTGLVGSIETVQGTPLHFFVGTTEEYNALSQEQKVNLFAIITDDTTKVSVDDIIEWKNAIVNGTQSVPNAETAKKATSDEAGNQIRRTYFHRGTTVYTGNPSTGVPFKCPNKSNGGDYFEITLAGKIQGSNLNFSFGFLWCDGETATCSTPSAYRTSIDDVIYEHYVLLQFDKTLDNNFNQCVAKVRARAIGGVVESDPNFSMLDSVTLRIRPMTNEGW